MDNGLVLKPTQIKKSMGLANAHEGYEYQDLLSAYFILNEILLENTSEFFIDRKEFQDDRIDDLKIQNMTGQQKIQIKYSGDSNHTFQKSDISGDSTYGIALDRLLDNWLIYTDKSRIKFRLCLSWNEPTDSLRDFIEPFEESGSFPGYSTRSFKINAKSIWPEHLKLPVASWRRFRNYAKKIERSSFVEFCNQLIIETALPKFSLNLDKPGQLENLVMEQVKRLGIGTFPNQHLNPGYFILSLVAIIKRARSKGTPIDTGGLFYELKIKTDYGTIEQTFPINQRENINRKDAADEIFKESELNSRIVLVGEPGSGKSWLLDSFQGLLRKKGVKCIRHYCYTKLDDLLQKERIQLNVFYGNLIHAIIQTFPNLKEIKKERYASSLKELNLLIDNIPSPTFIIIDGLDHIERIYNFRSYNEISRQDIAIIETLEKLRVSPMVKIVVTSQNIPQLRQVSSFHRMPIPAWSEEDVRIFLAKLKLKNKVVKKGTWLSGILYKKSAGNPLYLKYLVDELKKTYEHPLEVISSLPAYSYNLNEYYVYLLSQLNTREDVPQILSGINFSVNRMELEEITGSGDQVLQSLEVLAPILKINVSQSGYVIYHESFRRFIIDGLKQQSVSIDRKIFNPVIDWFNTKDFFKYRKAFRYFVPFLLECGRFDDVLLRLSKTYVTDSVVNGQPWKLIERNFKYFASAACRLKDLPSIILLNEINKVIATTQTNFENYYTLYFEALGLLNGFKYVSEYLLFEDEPILDAATGLKACFVCDQNNVVAPWEAYMELLRKEAGLESENYRYYIRGLIVLEDDKRINKMTQQALKMKDNLFIEITREEILGHRNQAYAERIISKYSSLKQITSRIKNRPAVNVDIFALANELLQIEYLSGGEWRTIENFFAAFRTRATETDLLRQLIDIFKSKNWFYNWIIYWMKIISLRALNIKSYNHTKGAFDYLKYTTDPFLGKPRVCDLYAIHYLIYDSFKEGLNLIETSTQWIEIIDLLTDVGNETTTTMQRSASGPLETSTLFRLFGEFISDNNRDYLNDVFERLTKRNEEYRLHADIGEHKLRLSRLFSLANDSSKATKYFTEGVKYMLAYTMRKDLTLQDVIEGVEWINLVDRPTALEGLRVSRVLIDSAIHHTDGRETNYFPNGWFERFLRIDGHLAARYLLNLLADHRHYWIAETSLMNFLCAIDGKINALSEYYLAFTFPGNDSVNFVSYCLSLHDQLKTLHPSQAEKLVVRISEGMRPKQNRSIPDNIIDRYNEIARTYQPALIVTSEPPIQRSPRNISFGNDFVDRKDFSNMTFEEIIDYIEVNGVRSDDLNSLCFLFSQYRDLNFNIKELIQAMVKKNNGLYSDHLDIDIIFQTANEIECYYWMCRFIYDEGGWFQRFVNHEALQLATNIDRRSAMEFLFELMSSEFNVRFNFNFSSNLIRALIDIGHNKEELMKMWASLLDMTTYRLPSIDESCWDSEIADEFDMDQEEILICMLLTRFKAATTERFRIVATGIEHLLETSPHKLEKPFKWFIKNREKFLQPAFSIILQCLFFYRLRDHNYHLRFERELQSIFPTRYFLNDFLISKLYGLEISELNLPKGIIYPQPTWDEFEWFSRQNRRFEPMLQNGIDLLHVFSKFKARFQDKYQDRFELYQNRVREQWVSHILSSDFLLELINVDLYGELKLWQDEGDDVFEVSCFLDTHAMSVYEKSYASRPEDLKKASNLTPDYSEQNVNVDDDWIRVAHVEKSFVEEKGLRIKPFYSYGAMRYSNKRMERQLPYSDNRIFPFLLWQDQQYTFPYGKEVVFAVFQDDALEFYKILWLNPTIVKSLGLETKITDNGLIAVTTAGEAVLRMRSWRTDYFGDSLRNRLSDEIPQFEGTDLIMRKDYFHSLSKMFSFDPSYVTVKIEGKFITDQD